MYLHTLPLPLSISNMVSLHPILIIVALSLSKYTSSPGSKPGFIFQRILATMSPTASLSHNTTTAVIPKPINGSINC